MFSLCTYIFSKNPLKVEFLIEICTQLVIDQAFYLQMKDLILYVLSSYTNYFLLPFLCCIDFRSFRPTLWDGDGCSGAVHMTVCASGNQQGFDTSICFHVGIGVQRYPEGIWAPTSRQTKTASGSKNISPGWAGEIFDSSNRSEHRFMGNSELENKKSFQLIEKFMLAFQPNIIWPLEDGCWWLVCCLMQWVTVCRSGILWGLLGCANNYFLHKDFSFHFKSCFL